MGKVSIVQDPVFDNGNTRAFKSQKSLFKSIFLRSWAEVTKSSF